MAGEVRQRKFNPADAATVGASAIAFDVPGAVAPADRPGLERALGAVDEVFPLAWKDDWFEVTLLGGS